MQKQIVWTIAGSDSSGCAGIQADMKTFNSLGVHGCTVITAVTAQSQCQLGYIQFVNIEPQLNILRVDLPPLAVKIGMLGNAAAIKAVNDFLISYTGKVILDPVMVTTSGGNLFDEDLQYYVEQLKKMFKHVDVLTPNLSETEMLLQRRVHNQAEVEQAARDILSLGVKSVLIKGGHFHQDTFSQDYWTNGTEAFWLASKRHVGKNFSGTGCTLSSAIAAACALGYDIKDAIVIAKMYVNQAMRLSSLEKILTHTHWPEDTVDLPYLSTQPLNAAPISFPRSEAKLGLYPIVDSIEWLSKLLPLGVTTIQLRLKNKSNSELENIIPQAIALAKQYKARLFINDYWQQAIRYGAYGVHLGQEDLKTAVTQQIYQAGLHLGISTHSYYEVARAHAFAPSYMACGPIFPTQSKPMSFPPQGLKNLKRWRRTLDYPLVAVGGIDLEKLPDIIAAKVDGIAVISAITQTSDPLTATKQLLALTNTL